MASLRYIDFRENQMSGTIPANLFDNNPAFWDFHIENNLFSGALPANLFVNNSILDHFDVSDNNFTAGTSIAVNIALERVDADRNNFTVGDINQFLIDLDSHADAPGAGYSDLLFSGQTPSAAPTGAGATAATNLLGRGWTLSTD